MDVQMCDMVQQTIVANSPFTVCHILASLIHAETALRPRTYPFSSDQGSQPGLGLAITRLSDRPGTESFEGQFVLHGRHCAAA